MRNKPLWQCPKCKRQFANVNQQHSCGMYTVEEHLEGKSDHAVELYTGFIELVERCGTVIIAPAKTRIGIQVRMIFAAINKITDEYLDIHIVLTRRIDHARFRRIESLSAECHVHHLRLHSVEELDDQLLAWLCEGYRMGNQEHLKSG